MQHAIRSQTDGKQDEWSDRAALDFTGVDVIVRTEYRDETDLNVLLARFGANTPVRQMDWGAEIDNRIDLQTALNAIEQAKRIMPNVPEALRNQFHNWQEVLNGVESGTYPAAIAEMQRVEKATAEQRAREQKEKEAFDAWRAAGIKETPPAPVAG